MVKDVYFGEDWCLLVNRRLQTLGFYSKNEIIIVKVNFLQTSATEKITFCNFILMRIQL